MTVRKLSLVFMLLASAAFASCGKDGNGNDPGNGEPAGQTAAVSYKFDGGADLLTLLNVRIRYTDASGESVTEEVRSLPWEKRLTSVKLPYTASMELIASPVENYEERDQYEVGQGFAIFYQTSDGRTYGSMNAGRMTIGRDKVAAYREKIVNSEKRASVEIAAK